MKVSVRNFPTQFSFREDVFAKNFVFLTIDSTVSLNDSASLNHARNFWKKNIYLKILIGWRKERQNLLDPPIYRRIAANEQPRASFWNASPPYCSSFYIYEQINILSWWRELEREAPEGEKRGASAYLVVGVTQQWIKWLCFSAIEKGFNSSRLEIGKWKFSADYLDCSKLNFLYFPFFADKQKSERKSS